MKIEGIIGIAIDQHNNIIVVKNNCRIQVFREDGSFLTKFGSKGNGDGQFYDLAGIAINQNNQILVACYKNCNIQIFN